MNLRHALPLVLALALVAIAGPVAADCQPAGPPAEVLPTAEVAFVGEVVDTDGPRARFAVSEVWAGQVADVVEVRGITDDLGANVIGEDDRQWTIGDRYLVIPFVDGDVLREHMCTSTVAWQPELEELRPGNAEVPSSRADLGSAPIPMALMAVLVVGVAVAGVSVLAFRRR
jgi:hypothetical protein